STLLAATLLVPAIGVAIALRGRARRVAPSDPVRQRHRRLGLLVALTLFASGASGLWHLVESAARAPLRTQPAPRIADAVPVGAMPAAWPALPPGALAELAIERRGDAVAWRWRAAGAAVIAAEHAHGPGAHHAEPAATDAAWARALAV